MPWIPRGLRDGIVTSRYPRRPDGYGDGFSGTLVVRADADTSRSRRRGRRVPDRGHHSRGRNGSDLDRGRCILCGRCAALAPQIFRFDPSVEVSATSRQTLWWCLRSTRTTQALQRPRVRAAPPGTGAAPVDPRPSRRRGLRRSEEWEVAALTNPDLRRAATGDLLHGQPQARRRAARHRCRVRPGCSTRSRHTYEVMPQPKVVIAAGTDAISGGLIGSGYASRGGVTDAVPVDVFVPGSPPTPFGLLHGILLAVGLLAPRRAERSAATQMGGRRAGLPGGPTGGGRPVSARPDGCRPGLLRRRAGHRPRPGRRQRAVAARCPTSWPGRKRVPGRPGHSCDDDASTDDRPDRLFGIGHNALRIDSLAGLFLTLLFAIAVCVSACFVSWVGPPSTPPARDRVGLRPLALASVAVISAPQTPSLFLFAWEHADRLVLHADLGHAVRSATSRCGLVDGQHRQGQRSGAAVRASCSWPGAPHSLSIASWHAIGPGAVHDVAWALVVVGFGAKVGLVPLQVWIPVGYPAAPGPARAAMAGIAANVGVYGLWRFLGVLGRPPVWLVIAVLLVGGSHRPARHHLCRRPGSSLAG